MIRCVRRHGITTLTYNAARTYFLGTKPVEFPWEEALEFSSTLNWVE